MTYQESIIKAKDAGVEFGLYSKEYAGAIKEMNALWLSIPKTKTDKFLNNIAKKIYGKSRD